MLHICHIWSIFDFLQALSWPHPLCPHMTFPVWWHIKVTCYENDWDAGRSVVWMALEYMERGWAHGMWALVKLLVNKHYTTWLFWPSVSLEHLVLGALVTMYPQKMEHPNFFLASFSRRVVTSSPCSPQLNSPGRCCHRDGATCVTKVLAHRVSCNEGPLEATFLRSVGSSKHETEWRLAQEVIMSHAQLLFTKLFFNCMSRPLFRYKVSLLATFYLSGNKIFSNLENFWHPTLKGESLQSQIQATTAQSFRGLSGHWKCTSFYTSRRCTSPRCVKLKRLSATAFAYRGCMYFFLWKLPQTLTDPNEPIETLRKKDKQQPEKTHTPKKHKKNKKQSKKHTHTHIMNTNKKTHAKTHCKTFRDSRWNLGTSSSLEKDSKIPALWRWLGQNRRIRLTFFGHWRWLQFDVFFSLKL